MCPPLATKNNMKTSDLNKMYFEKKCILPGMRRLM